MNRVFQTTREKLCSFDRDIREQFVTDMFYFWAEDDATAIGPFSTYQRACDGLEEYMLKFDDIKENS